MTFLGSNLYPANLINVIENNVTIKNLVERLAYHQYEKFDQHELDILVELKKGIKLTASLEKQIHDDIIKGLKENNEDFRGIQEKQQRVPGTKFYLPESGPMHEWSKKPGSKHKYVFRGNEIEMGQ